MKASDSPVDNQAALDRFLKEEAGKYTIYTVEQKDEGRL